jgi:hypothetical protein
MSDATGLLEFIAMHCECEVSVEINSHRNYYESVEQYMADMRAEVSDGVFADMVARDTIVAVQFYPSTPIGFYTVYHYDLVQALEIAAGILRSEHGA